MRTGVFMSCAAIAAVVVTVGSMQATPAAEPGPTAGRTAGDLRTTAPAATPVWTHRAPGSALAGGGTGPDVIVGSLPATVRWDTSGTETAYSVATTSCNIGTADLDWIDQPSNRHPVIGQNLYRLSPSGRFEQIGQSWLKHGFCALQQDLAGCGSCPNAGGCLQYLEPGCADPYSAGLNGSQGGLGPKWQVNPNTGVFPIPWDNGEGTSGNFRRRIRVQNVDLDAGQNPGALYFIEGHYVTQDDAASGNQNNNASYRRVNVNAGSFDLSFVGSTQMMKPAIQAWQDSDPTVTLVNVQVPGDGLFIVGYKVTDNGDDTWDYEYAVYNMNSDRAAEAFAIPVENAGELFGVGFHDINYHSGERWSGLDWPATTDGGEIRWSTTPFASDPNANALRWGTIYNFRFSAAGAPVPVNARLELFKSGSPGSIEVPIMAPEVGEALIAFAFPDGRPEFISPDGAPVRVEITETQPGGLVGGSPMLHYDVDGGGFQAVALAAVGGDLYEGLIGPSTCGDTISYYFSAETSAGDMKTSPGGAPANVYTATSAVKQLVPFSDDMQTDPGYSVVNVALDDGAWDRGVPAGDGTRGDPIADADGSGACWLTDNVIGNSDVDGGPTRLTTPSIDLSGSDVVFVSYARWFTNDDGDGDRLDVEVSNDDGGSWTLVESVGDQVGWVTHSFRLDELLTPTATVRLRFSATDNPNDSVTEAGIDAIRIETLVCDGATCTGDLDGDGIIGFTDLLEVLSQWGPCLGCPGDLDGDGTIAFPDLLIVLSSWGPCP